MKRTITDNEDGLLKTAQFFDPVTLIWLLASIIMIFLVVVPIGYMAYLALITENGSFTLMNFPAILMKPNIIKSLINTLLFAGGVAAAGVLFGVPLAFGVSRTNMIGKGLVRSSVIIAIITPSFLRTMGYILLAGPNAGYLNVFLRKLLVLDITSGPFNVFTLWGLLIIASPVGIAYVFILTSSALEQMDPSFEEASHMSGASNLQTIFMISLRLSRNAILSGALMAFTVSLAMFGAPYMLGIEVLTVSIRMALLMPVDYSGASVLSILVVGVSILTLVFYRRSFKSGAKYQTVTGKGYRPDVMHLGKSRHLFTILGIIYFLTNFFLPYFALVAVSLFKSVGNSFTRDNFTFRHYIDIFTTSDLSRIAVKNSFFLSVVTATFCVLLGIIIGYMIIRTKVKGKAILDYVSILPLGISGTALAVGLILIYTTPPLRALRLYGTIWIIMIAYIIRLLPLAVRSVESSLMQITTDLEESAWITGASWIQSMKDITLPLIRGGVAYAWVMIFLSAFAELSASIMLRNIGTDTVATAIMDLWDGAGGLQQASAMGTTVFILVMAIFFGVKAITGKSLLESEQKRRVI